MYRYHQVAAQVDGREVVLYRSENSACANLFKKLIGNRQYLGQPVYAMEVGTTRIRPTGILQPFVHKRAA